MNKEIILLYEKLKSKKHTKTIIGVGKTKCEATERYIYT